MTRPHPKCDVCGQDITSHHGKYRAWRKGYGFCSSRCFATSLSAKRQAAVKQNFMSKIDMKVGSCWEYKGHINNTGYGTYRAAAGSKLAHRMMWEFVNGPIPHGMCVCHSCDNPPCCNPDHLWLGTHKENVKDMWEKGRGKYTTRIGMAVNTAKLTPEDVIAIRASELTAKELAAIYSVSSVQIRNIKNRRHWRHV